MKTTAGAVAVLALLLCGQSRAHDQHQAREHTHWYLELDPAWYAGGAAAQTDFRKWGVLSLFDDGSYTSSSRDDGGRGFRLFAGADLSSHFSVELGYVDFGEATFQAQSDGSGSFWAAGPVYESLALKALDLALLGKLMLFKDTAAFVQLGAVEWEEDVYQAGNAQSIGPFVFQGDKHSATWSYGAGIHYDGLAPVRLAATYSSMTIDTTGSFEDTQVESMRLSLAYLF